MTRFLDCIHLSLVNNISTLDYFSAGFHVNRNGSNYVASIEPFELHKALDLILGFNFNKEVACAWCLHLFRGSVSHLLNNEGIEGCKRVTNSASWPYI